MTTTARKKRWRKKNRTLYAIFIRVFSIWYLWLCRLRVFNARMVYFRNQTDFYYKNCEYKWRNICHFSTYITSVSSELQQQQQQQCSPFYLPIHPSVVSSSSISGPIGMRCTIFFLLLYYLLSQFSFSVSLSLSHSFPLSTRDSSPSRWMVTCFTFIPIPNPQNDTHFSFSFWSRHFFRILILKMYK